MMAQAPLADAGLSDGGLPGVEAATVWRTIRAEQLAVPQGHQVARFAACGTAAGPTWATGTWYGVCGRPSDGGVVVTAVPDGGNTLGLSPGDTIVSTNQVSAPDFLEKLAREPVCGSSSPSAAHRTEWAAASLFGIIDQGWTLEVRSPVGTTRTVAVGPRGATSTWCLDPLGGYSQVKAKATLRTDGIGVIQINTFGATADHPFPTPFTNASYATWVSQRVEQIGLEFDKVKAAPGLVWDLRSNSGGSQEVALAVVGGFAQSSGVLTNCYARIASSNPPTFSTTATWSFSVAPTSRLAYAGRVAVIIDGNTYSAGDLAARAVREFAPTAHIVGRPSAGAFGYGGNAEQIISGAPGVGATFDQMKCVSAGGQPLEGQSTQPTIPLEYDPASLAAGIDNVMEAAVTAVR